MPKAAVRARSMIRKIPRHVCLNSGCGEMRFSDRTDGNDDGGVSDAVEFLGGSDLSQTRHIHDVRSDGCNALSHPRRATLYELRG